MASGSPKFRQQATKGTASRRKALGRGLAALMPTHMAPATPPPAAAPPAAAAVGHRDLPIEKLRPCKTQPRKHFDEENLRELAASIKQHGILQPVVVRRQEDHYEIVAGERRWRAASLAGLRKVPVFIKELSDSHALQIALIENVQRQDLDPLEEAEAYSRLIREHKLTQDQLATAVGKSRPAISNCLRLLKLPRAVLDMLADGRLSAGHARAMMALDDVSQVQQLASDVVGRGWSVRDTEDRVRRLQTAGRGGKKNKRTAAASVAEIDLQDRLTQALGTKVKLQQKRGRGRIEIYFHSLDALDALLDRLIA